MSQEGQEDPGSSRSPGKVKKFHKGRKVPARPRIPSKVEKSQLGEEVLARSRGHNKVKKSQQGEDVKERSRTSSKTKNSQLRYVAVSVSVQNKSFLENSFVDDVVTFRYSSSEILTIYLLWHN